VPGRFATRTILRKTSGAPDEPHAAVNVLKPQNCSTEDRSVGVVAKTPVPNPKCDSDCLAKYHFRISAPRISPSVVTVLRELTHLVGRVQVQITVELMEGVTTTWEAKIEDGCMLVTVPSGLLGEGSKQSLICLLELAESVDCRRCIVSFAKDRRDRPMLTKTFLFLGFCPLPPSQWPSSAFVAGQMLMAYIID